MVDVGTNRKNVLALVGFQDLKKLVGVVLNPQLLKPLKVVVAKVDMRLSHKILALIRS